IDAVLDKWKTIAAMPERAPAEIDAKKAAFDAFMSSGAAFVLKQIASIPIAQFYLPRTPENEQKLITDEAFREYWSGERLPQGQSPATAVGIAAKKRFFHWFLEFPEIIQRGGFDCILGNPPYLGGQALSGTYGHEFCNYVKHAYAPTGLSELVVFFLRRIFTLLRPGGFTAFITTNSIKDGDIRKDGLEQVVIQGGTINFAVRGLKWPGRANLVVSLVGVHKGAWTGERALDGRRVPVINPFLDDTEPSADPTDLSENKAKVFQGSIFLGDGFLLTHAEADRFRLEDSRNAEVLRLLLNGQELNNEPDQVPTRSIVNFADMGRDAASRYHGPFSRLEELVKPVRQNDKRASRRDRWWQYAERAAGLYSGILGRSKCFAAAATTKHLNFSCAPTDRVFANTIYVFTSDRWDHYSVVQSTLHEAWARKYSGSLETRLRYSPSDCFETFSFPEGLWQTPNAVLAGIGERYHEHRRRLMLSLWLGLTDVYNLFHSREVEGDLAKHFASRAKKDPRGESIPEEHRAGALSFTPEQALAGILELRRLHVELDTAVRDAYCWQDLPLEHAFYEVETLPENDRVRYTISPAARKELLKRLLAENHRRAAESADLAAHSATTASKPTKRSRRKAPESGGNAQPGLFDA
ncbi:MAG: Eco57I restriction-modification methylase domain-containing protein, partial [Planctomycetia bacterium]